MKTMWLAGWAAVALGMPSAGQVNTGTVIQFTRAEEAWVAAHPQVRWGVDPDWPPFSSFDRNGELVGIDADLTRLVAERTGLQLKIVRADSWTDMVEKANAGEVDFLSATAKIPGRLERFDYTDRYGSFPVVIITRDEAPFLTPMLNLGAMRIAACRDDAVTMQLERDFPTGHFVLKDTAWECLQMVARRKADATVQNLAVASRVIRVNGLTDLKISGVTHYEFPIHFAVRKDAPELMSILNKGMATITPAEQEAIYGRHLTPDIGKARDWSVWRRRAMLTALIGGVLTALVLAWSFVLKWEIKRRKEVEEALCKVRKRLEGHARELNVRVKEVEHLNLELTSANQNLESFSGSVSHDLRAPLRRIIGFADLLKIEAGDTLTKAVSDRLGVIVSEASRMDRLIYDLLEFARLGREGLNKERVNMTQLVKSVIDDFKSHLRERAVVWRIGDLPEVLGDSNLLRYAMINLIDNALKYTRRRRETRIAVDVLPEEQSEGEATFYVKDNGSGFDMSKATKIFGPFQRLHSSSEFEGTGMGLANVQKIIQKHGGRIWFESAPDKGATFYFTLPCSVSEPREYVHATS